MNVPVESSVRTLFSARSAGEPIARRASLDIHDRAKPHIRQLNVRDENSRASVKNLFGKRADDRGVMVSEFHQSISRYNASMSARRRRREHPKVEVPVWTLANVGVLLVAGLYLVSRVDGDLHILAGPLAEFTLSTRTSLAEVAGLFAVVAILLTSGLWYFHRQSTLSGVVCIASVTIWFWLGWFIVMSTHA